MRRASRSARLAVCKEAASRQKRHAAFGGELSRLMLEAEGADMFGPRPDEDNAFCRQALGEMRILREKAIAWMNRFRASLMACFDDRVDIEIGLGRRAAGQPHYFVRKPHRQA